MTKKIALVFLSLFFCNYSFAANQTITDCDGSSSAKLQTIQTKVNLANAGEEVFFDCASGNFTGTLEITKGITIRGRGQVKNGSNVSYLTTFTVSGAQIFNISVPNNAVFRLTGIEFTGNPGEPLMDLNGHFQSFRVDHCGFTNVSNRIFRVGYNTRTGGAIQGLIDNNTYTNTSSNQFLLYYGNDTSWNDPEDYGTEKAIYIEDNILYWNVAGVNNTPCDGEHGARFVIRKNTLTNAQFQWHDTGSTQEARSTRHFEIYDNTMLCNQTNCGWGPVGFRGGTGVFYNNKIPVGTNGYENASVSQIWRADQNGSTPWVNMCDNSFDKICSNFLSGCSTNADCGSGTCLPQIDGHKGATQSTSPATPIGWPCRDQTGRGQDDPVTHKQKASPMYWWSNRSPSGARLDPWMANDEYIQPNRDYYQEVSSFNGTAGVGVGLLSARPATCRGPIKDLSDNYELTGGVGYWATDENKLYHCSQTNTWSVLFAPLPYPHRLQGNNPNPQVPMPPTSLNVS